MRRHTYPIHRFDGSRLCSLAYFFWIRWGLLTQSTWIGRLRCWLILQWIFYCGVTLIICFFSLSKRTLQLLLPKGIWHFWRWLGVDKKCRAGRSLLVGSLMWIELQVESVSLWEFCWGLCQNSGHRPCHKGSRRDIQSRWRVRGIWKVEAARWSHSDHSDLHFWYYVLR